MYKSRPFPMLALLLVLLLLTTHAMAAQPLYPAIQGHLWGYIDADNQWVVPPYSLEQLWPVYDNDFQYDYETVYPPAVYTQESSRGNNTSKETSES